MRASLIPTADGGITLRVEAEEDIESIALKAWWDQHVTLPTNVTSMPTRHLLIVRPSMKSAAD